MRLSTRLHRTTAALAAAAALAVGAAPGHPTLHEGTPVRPPLPGQLHVQQGLPRQHARGHLLRRLLGRDRVEQHGELVAAEPRDRVAAAERDEQALGDAA